MSKLLLPWRQEILELLSRAGAVPVPALRRSRERAWLFACDLSRVSLAARSAFPPLAESAGWESGESHGWLHLRASKLLTPYCWLPLLGEGEEADSLRRLLSLHPSLRPDPIRVWDLLKALETDVGAAEQACRLLHRDLAAALRMDACR